MGVDPQDFDEANLHGFNRYAYGNNNPYKFKDPDGNSPLSVLLIEAAKYTGLGYAAGVAADAISQAAAFGQVDWSMAASSNAAMAGGEAGLLAGLGIGATKTLSTVGVERVTATAKDLTKVDPNKLNHIFGKAEHNLNNIVKEFGTRESAFNAIQQATQTAVKDQGLKGVFETTVRVGSESVTVRGNVVDGAVKIGTAFKP
jgi:hypothetical protein